MWIPVPRDLKNQRLWWGVPSIYLWVAGNSGSVSRIPHVSKQKQKRHPPLVRLVLNDTARLPTGTQRQHLISQDFSSHEFSLHSVPTHRLGSFEDQPLTLKATPQKKKKKTCTPYLFNTNNHTSAFKEKRLTRCTFVYILVHFC